MPRSVSCYMELGEFLTFTKINYGWFSGHYFMGLTGLEEIYDAMIFFAHILKSWKLDKTYLFLLTWFINSLLTYVSCPAYIYSLQ